MDKILCTTSTFDAGGFPKGYEIVKNPFNRRLTEEEAEALIKEHQPAGMVAGVEPLTGRVLSAARNLRVISRCGVGLDSVDLKAAKELGIRVFNTPEAPVLSVAELAVSFMLTFYRHIPGIDAKLREGEWYRPKGNLLSGKTVGILGCGRIGSKVAELLSGFNCQLLGYDPGITGHPLIKMVSPDELLHAADIVTLHLPATKETEGIVDKGFLKKMKKSAILINTSRGSIINEDDLFRALEDAGIKGACLDVYREEPYSGKLTSLEGKTVLTSHIASSAVETRTEMERQAVENLIKGLEE